jgi:hypothetical protein
VTRWGLLLLLAFLALGLRSSLDTQRALKYGVWTVVVVLFFVSVRNHAL